MRGEDWLGGEAESSGGKLSYTGLAVLQHAVLGDSPLLIIVTHGIFWATRRFREEGIQVCPVLVVVGESPMLAREDMLVADQVSNGCPRSRAKSRLTSSKSANLS